MKFWVKIEAILNKVIIAIMSVITSTISKLTPKKVKKSIEVTQDKSQKIKKSTQTIIHEKVDKTKKWGQSKVDKSKKIATNAKVKTQDTIVAAKTYDWKSLNPQKVMAIFSVLIVPFITKFKSWYATLKPTTIISVTAGTMALSLFSITIYQQTQEISEKSTTVIAEPEKFSDTMDKNAYARSQYRNYKEKRITLTSVNIPVYIDSRKGMQSLIIDFTMEAENRYIAQYFKVIENEYVLRDRLNKNIQPIIPEFPMKPEGKHILKKKIKDEINKLVDDLQIKGNVKDVYIHSILTD